MTIRAQDAYSPWLRRLSKGDGTKAADALMQWPPAGTIAIIENALSVPNTHNLLPLARIMCRASG
jgi:hypothetical protein